MNDRLEILRQLPLSEIDAVASGNLPINKTLQEMTDEIFNRRLQNVPVNYTKIIEEYLIKINEKSDFDIVSMLQERFQIIKVDSRKYSDPNLLISKINHGYWEHLAFLNAKPEHRNTYRDVNLELRRKHYLSNDFMDVLISSMLSLLIDRSISNFISTTTGKASFSSNLGAPWTRDDKADPHSYTLSPFKRGAVRGLLAFSHLVQEFRYALPPLKFYDSYENNMSFQDGSLFRQVKSLAGSNTICLIMGPPILESVRIMNWPGTHAFLAISGRNAMAQWRFNALNLFSVIDYYSRKGHDIVVLFQGAVVGPVITALLRDFRQNLETNIAFLDLGRLLDTAFEKDLTNTGSPLPNNSFSSGGQLILANGGAGIFQEHLIPHI